MDDDLLAGLEGDAREERIELIRWLREQHGIDDAALRRGTENGTVVLLAASRSLGAGETYSARDIARESGVPMDLWIALGRASGLPQPVDHDVLAFGEMDLEAARTTKRFIDAGLGTEQLLNTTHVLSRGLAQTAEIMRQTVLELAIEPGVSEKDLAATYAAVAEGLVPLVGPLVEQMLRIHLNHAVREEIVTAAERETGSLPGARDVGVAFADLVGFTRLGEELPPDDLERVAERLGKITAGLVEAPVRYVKSIGDAVLLVSPDLGALVRTAHALVAAADAEGEDFPQLRVGIAYGPAVSRAGDWFGRPVNLASRITTVARAGSVVADHAARKAIGDVDDLHWSYVGERKLKGVHGGTKLHRARPADPA